MKNVIVANFQPMQEMCSFSRLETYIKAQVENSLEVGWTAKDILLLTNFDFEFMGVKAQRVSLNNSCLLCSMTFAVHDLFKNDIVNEELWVHDLDAWQTSWFDYPQFKDVGIGEYSEYNRPRFNSGSVFYKPEAKDIVAVISFLLSKKKATREETIFDRVLSDRIYKHRVTVLNSTYNVGCSGFADRYRRSDQPIHVCHFHPDRRSNVEIHLLGRNSLNAKTVDERLEQLLRKYFDISTELSNEVKGSGASAISKKLV